MLYVYNKLGAAVVLCAYCPPGSKPCTCLVEPGGPRDVTTEVCPRALEAVGSHGKSFCYRELQKLVAANLLEYRWTSSPEYDTEALVVCGVVPGAHAASHASGGRDGLVVGPATALPGAPHTQHEAWPGVPSAGEVVARLDANAPEVVPSAQMGVPRTVDGEFPAGWTGGDLRVLGEDSRGAPQTEVLVRAAGSTTRGRYPFAHITQIVNTAPAAGPGPRATIRSGAGLGLAQAGIDGVVKVTVEGAEVSFAVDLLLGVLTPSVVTRGKAVEVWYLAPTSGSTHTHPLAPR